MIKKEIETANLEEKIDYLTDQISDKKSELDDFELDPDDFEDQYNDMLNDCYPEIFNILPSRILSELDPIAYSCGLGDYLDSLELEEDPNYKELEEELEELESDLENLEEKLEELENE